MNTLRGKSVSWVRTQLQWLGKMVCANERLKTSARRSGLCPGPGRNKRGGKQGVYDTEPDTSQDGVCVTQQGGGEQDCTGTSLYPPSTSPLSGKRCQANSCPRKAAGPCVLAGWLWAFLGEGKCPYHVRQTGDGQKGCLAQVQGHGGLGIPCQ